MGLGTWQLDKDTPGTIANALALGYRMIDTSGDYGTQPGIRKGSSAAASTETTLLRTTGGLITGAAAIMVAVFGGFAAGDLVPLQQTGFGLAAAVLIDATLVRSVLVPASMKLLGERNWYLPRWLEWLPNISVDSVEPPYERPVEVLVPSPATEG